MTAAPPASPPIHGLLVPLMEIPCVHFLLLCDRVPQLSSLKQHPFMISQLLQVRSLGGLSWVLCSSLISQGPKSRCRPSWDLTWGPGGRTASKLIWWRPYSVLCGCRTEAHVSLLVFSQGCSLSSQRSLTFLVTWLLRLQNHR